MTKWEYLRVKHHTPDAGIHWAGSLSIDETLNEYGAKGWELVAIVEAAPDCQNHRLTFKRPAQVQGAALSEVDIASLPDAALERIVSGQLVDTDALRARIADAVTEGARDGVARRALLDAVTGRLRGIALQLPGMSAARRQLDDLLTEMGAP